MPHTSYDKQAAVRESSQEFNCQDQQAIDALTTETYNACAAYVERAEELEVNPNPIPHVHQQHEEKAVFCMWAAWFFTVIGILVSIYLTATAMDSPVFGAIAAIAVFLMLEAGVKLGIAAAVSEKVFIRRFHFLYWPWLGVLLSGIVILWLGRNAGPELAAVLLRYSTMGWSATEVALLFLGACAFVGWQRYGWSGAAVRRVHTAEARIAELTKRIDRRNGKFLLLAVGFLTMGISAHAQCPFTLVDRSGSLADQDHSESVLVSAIAAAAADIPCIRVATFSAQPLSAESITIALAPTGFNSHELFHGLVEARKNIVREQARIRLQKFLGAAPRTPAACTSMLDVAARALLETGPVLIVTDGVHDCPKYRAGLPPGPSDHIFIILSPSKGDPANQFEIFSKRSSALHRLLPQCRIFIEGQADEAVGKWLGIEAPVGLVKVNRQ